MKRAPFVYDALLRRPESPFLERRTAWLMPWSAHDPGHPFERRFAPPLMHLVRWPRAAG
jgi:hypothetical protein